MKMRLSKSAPPALLPAIVFLFAATGYAQAHRLDAQAFKLPGKRLQVEAWFSDGDPARGAKVEVFHADGSILTTASLDDSGVYTFGYDLPQEMRIVISASGGHQKVLIVSEHALTNDPRHAVPVTERPAPVSMRDVLAGLGFLFGLAALVMAWRNGKRLRDLEHGHSRVTALSEGSLPAESPTGPVRH